MKLSPKGAGEGERATEGEEARRREATFEGITFE